MGFDTIKINLVLLKKRDQVNYLNVKYFESSLNLENLENLELECGPAQPYLFTSSTH